MITSPWKKDFPFLQRTQYCYLDSAATSIKPQGVIDAVNYFYYEATANVARGEHPLTEQITQHMEQTRKMIAHFINANSYEIIFTPNCTDSLNMLAANLLPNGGEVIVSLQNHHAALLPFMQRAKLRTIAQVQGNCDLAHYHSLFNNQTRLIVIPLIANVTGTMLPVKELCAIAREHNVLTVVDAAQAIGHIPVDVLNLDCDFLCFSAHKMLGPSGVGCLYGRKELLQKMKPTRLGGGIITQVTQDSFELKDSPYCFEAGTPNLEGLIGLGAAVNYLQAHDFIAISNYLVDLEHYARQELKQLDGITPSFDYTSEHAPIFNFHLQNQRLSTSQLASLLAQRYGIITNLGQQCCQPLYTANGIKEGIRVSFYLYNDHNDVNVLVNALQELVN